MDRLDEQWMREEKKIQREADIQAAGPLLNDRQKTLLEQTLISDAKLPALVARDIIDTINGCAGAAGASPREVIREALNGHIKKGPFTDNITQQIGAVVQTALGDRDQRIIAINAAPAAPTAAAPAVKSPGASS